MQNKINMGHARAYLGLDSSAQQMEAHAQVLKKQLSVRQTERLVKRMKSGAQTPPSPPAGSEHEFMLHELRKVLGTKVSIRQTGKRGKLIIEFYSPGELERIFELLTG
jgi:ParB family chromosome partitioning protein